MHTGAVLAATILTITAIGVAKYWLAYRAQRLTQEHQTIRALAPFLRRDTTYSGSSPVSEQRESRASTQLDTDPGDVHRAPTTTSSSYSQT